MKIDDFRNRSAHPPMPGRGHAQQSHCRQTVHYRTDRQIPPAQYQLKTARQKSDACGVYRAPAWADSELTRRSLRLPPIFGKPVAGK